METYRAWQDGPTFHWETVLGFRDCDEQKQQRLSSLLDLLVEASGRDYALRGFPHERMVALRQVFLLSRLRLRIVRPLRHPERAEVVTWEDGTVGARVRREYELRDGQGALCCAARSEWLLADPVDHRLLWPHFNGCEIPAVNRTPDCPDCDKLPHHPQGLAPLETRVVRRAQLDGNGHLYSAGYGDLLTDLLPDGGRSLRSFEINYIRECRLGETLELQGALTGDELQLYGFCGGELRFACRAARGE